VFAPYLPPSGDDTLNPKMHPFTGKLYAFLKKPVVLTVTVLLFLCSSLITITGGIGIAYNYLHEDVQHKQRLYEKLDSLATETNILYFKSVLGEPIYINPGYSNGLKEFIFVDPEFYVQAITSPEDKVIGYSVTTRDLNFNPKVPLYDIRLGISTFTEVKTQSGNVFPDWIVSYLGAHDLFYTEGYYSGNPRGYQTTFFSMTASGYIDDDNYMVVPDYESPDILSSFKEYIGRSVQNSRPPVPDEVIDFWKSDTNTVNTYTILGPFVSFGDIAPIRDGSPYYYIFGPDLNQVRLLKK
jgi:hypothetical protein